MTDATITELLPFMTDQLDIMRIMQSTNNHCKAAHVLWLLMLYNTCPQLTKHVIFLMSGSCYSV